tara:strand:- start:375 stop:1856 length:1482 start_codon:yes stop_codon:yes gene_type:complete
MNLVYSCIFNNENYLIIIEKLLNSFYKHNKDSNIVYLIITDSKLESKIIEICEKINLNFKTWIIDICNYTSNIDNIYESTYARYYIYAYPEIYNYEKILYLDCDILILSNLELLFRLELSNLLYVMYEKTHRTAHGSLFNNEEYEIFKNNNDSFTSALFLFNNNSIILDYFKNIYIFIKNFHKENSNPLHCYDQPIVNRLNYNKKIIDNKLLSKFCKNLEPFSDMEYLSNIDSYFLCHFPTTVGDSESKIKIMSVTEKYLNKLSLKYEKDISSLTVRDKKTKILIGTPAYGGQCYTGYTESLLYTIKLLENSGIETNIKFINNQIVTRARNMIASIFMEDDSYTHLLFIDSDIKWNPQDVLLLLKHNKECVIGVYPNKRYNHIYQLNPSSVFFKPSIIKENLIKVKYAATGFMMLKKSALKKIEKDIGIFYLPSQNDIEFLYNYFDCNIVDTNYLTEYYYFSHLLYKNNGEIWADTTIKLYHIGTHHYGELTR